MLSDYGIVFVFSACISAVFSASVVLSGIVFPDLIAPRRIFSHILFFISLSDLLGSIANIIGFPDRSSLTCHVQAFLTLEFFPASWMWTLSLCFQLRCVMIFNKVWLRVKHIHLVIWVLSLLLALVPLATNIYGQDDQVYGLYPCALGGDASAGEIWATTNFGILFLLICFIMMAFKYEVGQYFSQQAAPMTDKIRNIYSALRWYPICMFLVWFPMTTIFFINTTNTFPSRIYVEPFVVLSTQYGTILAILFFRSNKSIRLRWQRLLGLSNFLSGQDESRTGDKSPAISPNNSKDVLSSNFSGSSATTSKGAEDDENNVDYFWLEDFTSTEERDDKTEFGLSPSVLAARQPVQSLQNGALHQQVLCPTPLRSSFDISAGVQPPWVDREQELTITERGSQGDNASMI